MWPSKKLIAAFSFLFLFSVSGFSQDSLGAVHVWNVESKKLEEGKYELTFKGNITGNWQVYAPNQTLLDEKTTVLKFPDSSIVQDGDFITQGTPREITNIIFENKKVSVYESSLQWKAIIRINGTVPAKKENRHQAFILCAIITTITYRVVDINGGNLYAGCFRTTLQCCNKR